MKRQITTVLAIVIAIICISAPARAQTFKMMFWYPGEAGTTEEAQGPIDAMFDYLNKKIAPDKITGKYFNTVDGGSKYLSAERPDLAIVSYAAYIINADKLVGSTPFLKTLPLPGGIATENFVVMGKGEKPANFNIELYTKQPLTSDFAAKYVVNDVSAKPLIVPVNSIIQTIKEIDAGTKSGGIILQPMEYFTVKNITQPWAKNMIIWKISAPVASAPFLSLNGKASQKLKDEMLKMSGDPEGRAILETLRLKGFAN